MMYLTWKIYEKANVNPFVWPAIQPYLDRSLSFTQFQFLMLKRHCGCYRNDNIIFSAVCMWVFWMSEDVACKRNMIIWQCCRWEAAISIWHDGSTTHHPNPTIQLCSVSTAQSYNSSHSYPLLSCFDFTASVPPLLMTFTPVDASPPGYLLCVGVF